jgi:hypothetical protein
MSIAKSEKSVLTEQFVQAAARWHPDATIQVLDTLSDAPPLVKISPPGKKPFTVAVISTVEVPR